MRDFLGASRQGIVCLVSVPLRGKEGAGRWGWLLPLSNGCIVSVPLRGKEGAGPNWLSGALSLDSG